MHLSTFHFRLSKVDETIDQVFVYDVNSELLVATVDVGFTPIDCIWSNDDSKIYVSNSGDNDIAILNSNNQPDIYSNTFNDIQLSGIAPIGIDITQNG